ncbi:hypothetical protein GCM10022251_67820 [Phytohabitans flavus]|uniref:DUF1772 domain-containing protein n=1 Tax=Phytohabitans flavus TaxID=1076124 RepID=A0A6F8XQL9_9ACTN|nr:DUF1772 domain-containing protein [Phytohabitans flavus]BCB76107.1 hypothetical protein Pflav_025170 [Phytohabitans flavus]
MTAPAWYQVAAEQAGDGSLFAATVLVLATMTTGVVTGVFGLYANTIMPGLGKTDDRTFVGAFQQIDRAIINPLFMAFFFGALILTGLAGALHLGDAGRRALPWIAIAFGLYLIVVIITIAVNVPLNDAIKSAGDPDRINDLAQVRRDFNEDRWRAFNWVRVVLSTSSFALLCVALLQHGRQG